MDKLTEKNNGVNGLSEDAIEIARVINTLSEENKKYLKSWIHQRRRKGLRLINGKALQLKTD